MYLKSIEVQGFKSFANKMTFDFHNGITGIVGPNGSGKSNIGDAVRWVLGEQSAKQLRGGKMEDVIFAGTELRKPVSYAGVAITIDNSDHALAIDYDQVTVTRKVFRSGESEYLINGSPCRLKDINELFYDTGIGKEGYSIIGQGQIDRILSGKPEERRELFDEAAGIVKFKRRKAEAQKKLNEESQHLVRVNDILSELEKQVGPLERQSEKAKEYLKLKEELKKGDINLFILESEATKKELKLVNEKYKIATDELSGVQAQLDESAREYGINEARLNEFNLQIDENTSELNQAAIDKNKLLGQIEIINEQIKSVTSNGELLNNRRNDIKELLEDKEDEKKRLISERFAIVDKVNELRTEKDRAEKDVKELSDSIEYLEKSTDEAKNQMFDVLNEMSQVKSRLQHNETLLGQINIRKAELTRQLINCKSEQDTQNNSLSQVENELDRIKADITATNEALFLKEKELQSKKEAYNNNNLEITNLTKLIMSETSKLESLRNITERYDGYGNSIRRVMECKENNDGILGVVADIIKTKKQYETAIETALGGTIQNIVTDTEETAKGLIAFLKNNKYGRATFLPLSAISGKDIRADAGLLKEKGAIGFANTLVECDAQFAELTKYLLGRILVADNIDNALAIARKHNHSVRIVTLEGDMLSPGGSMSGGAFKNNSNLLGRRREIDELEESIKKNEITLGRLNENAEKIKNFQSELVEFIEQLRIKLKDKELEENTATLTLEQAKRKHNELTTAYSNSKRESENIDKQVKDIRAEIDASKQEIASLNKSNDELTILINENTTKTDEKKALLIDKQEKANQLSIDFANLTQKDSFAEENVKRVLREISRLNDELKGIDDSLGNSDDEINAKKENISLIEESIKKADSLIEEYTEQLSKMKEERDSVSEQLKKLFVRREEISEHIRNLDKEIMKLSSQIEQIEKNQDARIDYMWSEYELTLKMAEEFKDESLTDINDIRLVISRTKNDIKKLGEVNVNAIEDYKEVSERYSFLKTQHDDLIKAKDELTKIIEDLDTGMRTQFVEKFQEIKLEFDKVFKEMFGGGRGTIELEEEADVLEAGIRIISQPPGKKLQNMMQLSGGEKALTAIALLFAIQNLKPSPFCLLDEIEAALDDSNVDRFAKYLHKLTKFTQFIVITHRRGTMAAADRLYGITMQEKGVSTLVSVDLIKDQLEEKPVN